MTVRPHTSAGAFALWLAVALAGCTVGPNFHQPEPLAPAHYAPAAPDVASRTAETPVDATWWDSFHDPELSSLVARLASGNLDLQTAQERITAARARRRIPASAGLPHVEGSAVYRRVQTSENGIVTLVVPSPGVSNTFDFDQTQLQASWELDLFGRVRRATEAEGANTQAAVEARRSIALEGEAELARTYVQLRGLQAREAVLQRNVASVNRRRALVRQRYVQGVATLSDIADADAQAASIGENLPTLHASHAQAVNALGLLLGLTPRALAAELAPPAVQPPLPPVVPVGLPSELARRRPDIREAEARLHAATAETGVAVAAFYPDVSLTGSFGDQALSIDQLFAPGSGTFMVGPSVSVPFFEGGRLRGELQMRRAEQREAAVQYRQTVLQAWREVDDALTNYGEAQHRRGEVEGAAHADATALQVAERRYDQGVETLIGVTVAQASVLRDQDQLAQVDAEIRADLVVLYATLGGGWAAAEPAAPSRVKAAY